MFSILHNHFSKHLTLNYLFTLHFIKILFLYQFSIVLPNYVSLFPQSTAPHQPNHQAWNQTREKIHSKAQRNTKTKPIHLPSTPENPQNSHTSITQIKSNLKQIPKKKKTLDNCDALEWSRVHWSYDSGTGYVCCNGMVKMWVFLYGLGLDYGICRWNI